MSGILVYLLLIAIVFIVLAVGFYGCNRLVSYCIYARRRVFSSKSKVRNVDFLAIGELPDNMMMERLTGKSQGVSVFAPGASFVSCYEVLRHTHSILNEKESTVILAYNKAAEGYTIFDMPFFNKVSITRLGLKNLKRKSKYPLLFHPLASVRFLCGIHKKDHSVVECRDNVVSDFCRERNIRLILLEV